MHSQTTNVCGVCVCVCERERERERERETERGSEFKHEIHVHEYIVQWFYRPLSFP